MRGETEHAIQREHPHALLLQGKVSVFLFLSYYQLLMRIESQRRNKRETKCTENPITPDSSAKVRINNEREAFFADYFPKTFSNGQITKSIILKTACLTVFPFCGFLYYEIISLNSSAYQSTKFRFTAIPVIKVLNQEFVNLIFLCLR